MSKFSPRAKAVRIGLTTAELIGLHWLSMVDDARTHAQSTRLPDCPSQETFRSLCDLGLVVFMGSRYPYDPSTAHLTALGRDIAEMNAASTIREAEAQSEPESDPLSAGDRVEAGEPGTEDYDTGTVVSVDGDTAVVGWYSCVQTAADVDSLRRI